MTKKQLQAAMENLVEQIAVANGATVKDKTMIVGGRETTVRVADGGFLDLDGARRVLAAGIQAHAEILTSKKVG